jgi:hypothetical protein
LTEINRFLGENAKNIVIVYDPNIKGVQKTSKLSGFIPHVSAKTKPKEIKIEIGKDLGGGAKPPKKVK